MSLSHNNYYNLLLNLQRQSNIIIKPLKHNNNNYKLINSYRIKLNKIILAKEMYDNLSEMILSIPSRNLPPGVSKFVLQKQIVSTKLILNATIRRIKTSYNLINNLQAKSIAAAMPLPRRKKK
mgnify:CR=1 FL=1